MMRPLSMPRRLAIGGAALYGLRWAVAAWRTQRRLAPLAAAGDRDAQQSVTQRPEANLFGVPNSAYGIAYYTFVVVMDLVGLIEQLPWYRLLRLATLAAVARSLSLLVSLARSRTWCSVCMRGHAANAVLAVLLLFWQRD